MSAAYRRYWLEQAVPFLRAQDRLETGNVSTGDLYDVALLAFGDEGVAADILSSRLEALNRQASLKGA